MYVIFHNNIFCREDTLIYMIWKHPCVLYIVSRWGDSILQDACNDTPGYFSKSRETLGGVVTMLVCSMKVFDHQINLVCVIYVLGCYRELNVVHICIVNHLDNKPSLIKFKG